MPNYKSKPKELAALIIGIIGMLVAISGWLNAYGERSGYFVIFFGAPLIIIGIILLLIGAFEK